MRVLRTEYTVENNHPVVYCFTRDESGKRHIVKDKNLIPYFYCPEHDLIKFEGLSVDPKVFQTITGLEVRKVFTALPEDVPNLRSKVSKHYEADVLFPIRYLIDKVDVIEQTEPTVLFIDIETDNNGRIPNADIAEFPIVCLTIHNSQTDIYDTYVFRENLSPGIQDEIFEDKFHQIHYFRAEDEMLQEFIKEFRAAEPDVICGWNVLRFDLRYLISRMRVLSLNTNNLSPMQHAYSNEKDIIIKGIALVDLYDAYRRFTPNVEESYKLDFIARKVIGKGKTESDLNIRFLWKNKLDDLIKYNTTDCAITKGIDDKLKLLNFMDEIRRLCHCQLEDTLVVSKIVDCYVLKLMHNKKVLPSREHHTREDFEGGFVGSWAKGIYNNVVVFDLKSLYPSIIVGLNLSIECITDKQPKDEENYSFVNNYWVKKTPQGFLPEVIGTLFVERGKYRDLMKTTELHSSDWEVWNGRQDAIKVIMNAIYGQTAFPNSRLYSPNVADTTTFVGRSIIAWTKKQIEEQGYKVLYGDTDSVFWTADKELTEAEIEETRKKINESYSGFAAQFGMDKHIFETESDKVYRRWFAVNAKKRYAGNCTYQSGQKTNSIIVTGFEVRRSDASQFSRALQLKVFEMLLKEDKKKEEVLRYIGSEIDRIRKGKYTFTEIGIPKGITKELSEYDHAPANIRGARYAQDVLKLQISDKPKMLYISQMPEKYPHTDVLCFDEESNIPAGTQIDSEKMLTKICKDKLESIFEALGWSLTDLDVFWRGKPKGKFEQPSLF